MEMPLSDPWISVSAEDEDCNAKLIKFLFCGALRFLDEDSVGVVTLVLLLIFELILTASIAPSSGEPF